MELENTLFERQGSVSFGLTYMTGALVKIGQGLATLISGGARFAWVPYLLLWIGLVSGAAIGALPFGFSGLIAYGSQPAMPGSSRWCCWPRANALCPNAPRLSPKASAPETKRRPRAICAARAEYGCACLHVGLSSTPDNQSRQRK